MSAAGDRTFAERKRARYMEKSKSTEEQFARRDTLTLPRRKLSAPSHATDRPVVHASVIVPGRGSPADNKGKATNTQSGIPRSGRGSPTDVRGKAKHSQTGIPTPGRARSNSRARPVASEQSANPAHALPGLRNQFPIERCYRCKHALDDDQIVRINYTGGKPVVTRWHSSCQIGLIAEEVLKLVLQDNAPKGEDEVKDLVEKVATMLHICHFDGLESSE
ncbi:uncharacterized protein BO97DRAFT_449886 [Aspergillus homomorphus CBS 101889]|uniref:Uncharacterized protein n=1 Tax=Aspergillus homomorphus (strain CBS 101889) TaxID=1450537 RepID=A0A395I0I6_ASPHC|nr:hypothetical protein BO97DRAFT_449886 [Aspergillus homomorphus CBS 101889]RAL13306.1 hypothetical protein BO97DRAFT_449886 [Aspergillus homomorphus CBS 101889]